MIFNDRFPRATTSDLSALRPSTPDEHTLPTMVRTGVTIGTGAIIGNDLELGRWSIVGMGSVVTKSVPPFHLVVGNPARSIGCVCRCGEPLLRWSEMSANVPQEVACGACGLRYGIADQQVTELSPPKP